MIFIVCNKSLLLVAFIPGFLQKFPTKKYSKELVDFDKQY